MPFMGGSIVGGDGLVAVQNGDGGNSSFVFDAIFRIVEPGLLARIRRGIASCVAE